MAPYAAVSSGLREGASAACLPLGPHAGLRHQRHAVDVG